MPKIVEIYVVRIRAVGRSKKSGEGGNKEIEGNLRENPLLPVLSKSWEGDGGTSAPLPPGVSSGPALHRLCVLLESSYCFEKMFEETSSKIKKLQLRKHEAC